MPNGPDPAATGRRSYDREIDPMIEIAIEERTSATRHLLRDEFTVALLDVTNKLGELAKTISAGNLQSTKEHAVNKACIEEVRRDIAALKPLIDKVNELEQHDSVEDARKKTRDELLEQLAKGRRWVVGTTVALAGVMVAATALLLNHS